MIRFLIENVEKYPHLTFVEFGEKKYAYDEFLFQVIHTARILKSYDILKESLVGIYVQNPLENLVQWFACNYLGYVSINLNPKFKKDELQHFIGSTQLKTIITSRKSINQINQMDLKSIFIEDVPSTLLYGDELSCFKWDKDATNTIIFTSGSDGLPKPVELTSSNFILSFKSWNHEIQFKNDKIINFLPLHHIAGISAIFRGLISHSPIYLIEKFQIKPFIKICNIFKPTIVSLVPTIVFKLLKSTGGLNCLKSFRMILVGGGPSNKRLLKTCLKEKINVFVTYGMTETCSGVAGFWIKDYPEKLDSAGKPFQNLIVTTNVNTEQFSPICVLGEIVAKGYLGGEKFEFQFQTGDFGKFDEEGFLYLKPLRKDRIVTGGENVNPREVENVIQKINQIKDCCVLGIKDDELGEKVFGFVKNVEEISESEILKFCGEKLLDYKIPKKIIFCEELPKDELGKIKRGLAQKLITNFERI